MAKKIGDRKDAKRVKDMDPLHIAMAHLMNRRCDAEVYLSEKIDVTELLKYIEKKNKGLKKEDRLTIFHCFVTSFARMVYERPVLNRFIQGRKFWDRNDVTLAFVAKTQFTDTAEEMLIYLKALEDDNIDTIKEKILTKVRKIRKEGTNSIDKVITFLTKGPRFLTALIVKIIKVLDYYGKLPSSLIETLPQFATIFISNLGSINCNYALHHLDNFGSNSIFITIGTIHKEEVFIDGKKEIRDIVEIGATVDERIADGFYFARSIILFKEVIKDPKNLEKKLGEKMNYEIKR